MLQLVNANTLASTRAEMAESQIVQAAQQNSAEDGTARFELAAASAPAELAQDSAADLIQALFAEQVEMPLASEPLPAAPVLNQAQQWLDSMLQQHAVQLSARETSAEAAVPAMANLLLPAAALASAGLTPPLADSQAMANPRLGGNHLLPGGPRAVLLNPQSELSPTAPHAPVAQALTAPSAAPSSAVSAESEAAALTPLLQSLTEPATNPSALSAPAIDGPAPQPQVLLSTLKLQAPQAQYGQQMLNSLRDSVELQLSQQVQNATIRLDPPELGSLEIYLRHDNGRLTVQLSASNSDVMRLLQQTGERLRQELVGQNFVQVNVQVSSDSQGGRQGGQQAQSMLWADERIGASQDEPAEAPESRSVSSRDVLVTV